MSIRRLGPALIGGLCTVLVLGGVVVMAAAPAVAAACNPESLNPRADFDGDGSADVAVGMPWYEDGFGAVDLRGTGSPAVLLSSGSLGAGTGEGDGFGSAIAVGDLDGDGCADLVVGAPAEGQSARSDGAGDNEGQVHLVFGEVGGVDTSSSIMLPHDSSNLDHFGHTLALVERYDAATARTVHDLYVGAPRATVSGHRAAGEVFRYTIAPSATGRVTATLREVRSQDSPGVPGVAEAGDGFGAVLATTDRRGVLVGAPDENIGSVADAGAVWFLRVNAAGNPITSQAWSQNTAGVAGVAEARDHFGAALSSRGSVAAVGVPEEDGGSKVDSGMVQILNETASNWSFAPGAALTQKTPGIPGALEAGDRFGAAVAAGVSLRCPESIGLAIGAPGEDIGTRQDAGAIVLFDTSGWPDCPATVLRQGSGLAGATEAGDEVGSVLGLTSGRPDLEEDYADRLLIGVPKEDLGAMANAGMVQPARGGIRANGTLVSSLKFSRGYLLTSYYGMVLSSPSS